MSTRYAKAKRARVRRIKNTLKEKIEEEVQKTIIGKSGYHPLNDNNILSSVNELMTIFSEESGKETDNTTELIVPDFSLLKGIFIELGFSIKESVNFGSDEAGAEIKGGKNINLRINLNEDLQTIVNSPMTSTIKDIVLTTNGIHLKYKGTDIIVIKKAKLEHGGTFKLLEYDLLAENIKQVEFARSCESLIRLFAIILNARKYGQYSSMVLGSTPASAINPVIVDGLTKSFIENEIGKILLQSIKEYRYSVTNEIDLYKSIGAE